MRNPATRTLQLARFAERKLQQYKIVGQTPKGRGPVIVLLDESGSMNKHDRHTWATAAALACLGHAAREDRACTVIGFNAGVRYVLRMDKGGQVWSHERGNLAQPTALPGGCAAMAMLVATSEPKGGTDFSPPVQCALDLDEGVTGEDADLVLVTDGQAELPVEIMDRLTEAKQGGLRIFGLTVGNGSIGKAVSHLCDHVADLDSQQHKVVANALP